MLDSIGDLLSNGIKSTITWFFTFIDSVNGSWSFITGFIAIGFLMSLLIPFIGSRVRAGYSNKAKAEKNTKTKSSNESKKGG